MKYKVNDIKKVCEIFLKGRTDNGRYLSYDHCYYFFQQNYSTNNDGIKDLMSLHLFAYLSSWGMLRKSFVMQKDYKFHRPIIDLLCEIKKNSSKELSAVEISRLIRNKYEALLGQDNERKTWDTLTSKIIMGTLGSCPAYDVNFKCTAGNLKMCTHFNENSMKEITLFIKDNLLDILDISSTTGYPVMKIVDMYFWQKGYLYTAINNLLIKIDRENTNIEDICNKVKSLGFFNEDNIPTATNELKVFLEEKKEGFYQNSFG